MVCDRFHRDLLRCSGSAIQLSGSTHLCDSNSGVECGNWLPPIGPVATSMVDLGGSEHSHNPLVRASMSGDSDASAELVRRYELQAPDWNAWLETLGYDYSLPLRVAFAEAPRETVLEVSCGTEVGSLSLGLLAVVLCDPAEEMLRQIDRNRFSRVVAAANDHLPFRDSSFDTIFALNGVPSPREFLRLLRPAGTIVWAYSQHDQTPVYIPFERLAEELGLSFTAQLVGQGSWARFHWKEDS